MRGTAQSGGDGAYVTYSYAREKLIFQVKAIIVASLTVLFSTTVTKRD